MKFLKTLSIVVAFIILLVAAFYTALPWFLSIQSIQDNVTDIIEEANEGNFHYEKAQFSYFPSFAVSFSDVTIGDNTDFVSFRGNQLTAQLDMFQLLMGKFDIKRIRVPKMNIQFLHGDKELNVPEGSLLIHKVSNKNEFDITFEGNLGGDQGAFGAEFKMTLPDPAVWVWKEISIDGEIHFDETSLALVGEHLITTPIIRFENGSVDGSLKVQKRIGDAMCLLGGDLDIQGMQYLFEYGDTSQKSNVMDALMQLSFRYDPLNEQIIFQPSHVDFSAGQLDFAGDILWGTRDIRELRLSFSRWDLEQMVADMAPVKEWIPTNIGFSGFANMDITLQGKWEHLNIYSNFDFQESYLSYSNFFSKPKGVLFNLALETLLKQGREWEGNFSLRLKDVLTKGSLTEFNAETKEGMLNFITNKFDVDSIQEHFLSLQDYDLKGKVKLLGNFEGDMRNWEGLKKVINVSVQNGKVSRKKGQVVEGIQLILDYGDMALSAKNSSFRVGDSRVDLNFDYYHKSENDQLKLSMDSDQLEPFIVLYAVQDVLLEWIPVEVNRFFENSKIWLNNVFPKGKSAKKFGLELDSNKDDWTIQKLAFEIYEGSLDLEGKVALRETPWMSLDATIRNWNLQQLLSETGNDKSSLTGIMDIDMDFDVYSSSEEEPISGIRSTGSVTLRNGAIPSVELDSSLKDIPVIKDLDFPESDAFEYKILKSNFSYAKGKLMMPTLLGTSESFYFAGSGEITGDRQLNYRLDLYLREELSQEMFGQLFPGTTSNEDFSFGPMEFNLSGSIEDVRLQHDSRNASSLSKVLTKGRASKVQRTSLEDDIYHEIRLLD